MGVPVEKDYSEMPCWIEKYLNRVSRIFVVLRIWKDKITPYWDVEEWCGVNTWAIYQEFNSGYIRFEMSIRNLVRVDN